MFCGKCGAKLKGNEKFCLMCGNAISQENDTNNPKTHNYPLRKIRIKRIIKRTVIAVLVVSIILTCAYQGLSFYAKQIGKVGYKCTYDEVKMVSKKICKNIKDGDAKVDDIDRLSYGDFSVTFNVKLSGKQEETVKVEFLNYKDNDEIASVCVYFNADSNSFHEKNTYKSCIAVASAIEKTFLGLRYVDEDADYNSTMEQMSQLDWDSEPAELSKYIINDASKVLISVDDSMWIYKLDLPLDNVIEIGDMKFDLD